MTLTLELTREEETVLQRQAQTQGVDVDTLVRARLFGSHVVPPQRHDLAATLQAWIAEDATEDPEEIRKSEEETAEFVRNLQANRVDFGEGRIPL